MTAQPPEPSGENPATDAGQSARAHGFPSPARDYLDGGIDLNRELVRDRTSTFLMRVTGQALAASGIHEGDEIVVDRAGTPRHGSVVVVVFEGELLVRRLALQTRDGVRHAALETDDGAAPREVGDLQVWGVAT